MVNNNIIIEGYDNHRGSKVTVIIGVIYIHILILIIWVSHAVNNKYIELLIKVLVLINTVIWMSEIFLN